MYIALALALLTASPPGVMAQDTVSHGGSAWILPGSDGEQYLRYLQTLGLLRRYPWSARAFSTRELRSLVPVEPTPHWKRMSFLTQIGSSQARNVELAPVTVNAWYNSGFPFGMNDGAVWTGRGLTGAVSVGASARWGPLEVTLAPVAFWAENRAFPLAPTADSTLPFTDPAYGSFVDRPQRFGNRPYARVNAGASAVRLEYAGAAIGFSTAHESWGPMTELPLILGTNAPGFPHVFAGTAHPLVIGVGRLHARIVYASLGQSDYSPVSGGTGRRFGAGMVAVFEPRFIPGLELGAARFFHVAWPDSGLTSTYFTHLFQSFLKQRVGRVFVPALDDPNTSTDNQLASIFARWVAGRSGFEVYGEYGREDHNRDPRDLTLEPDHAGAFGLGARKAWLRERSLLALRAEMVNFQASSLWRHRPEESWYWHYYTRQGHTNEGQLLATAFATGGGAGATLVIERFHDGGLTRGSWSRFLVRDRPDPRLPLEVQHVLTGERVFLQGNGAEVHAGLDLVQHANRNGGGDVLNVRVRVGWRWQP